MFIQQDTVRLMRECGYGIKMGVSAIDEVYDNVCSDSMKTALDSCRQDHVKLGKELKMLLTEYGQEEKEPCPIVKGMSWVKTNMSLAVNETDANIADIISDGCSMGVKNLNRFLNKYRSADERSKDITKRLCRSEEKLLCELRPYL